MRKMTAAKARELDWSKFPDARPREGVVYPKGQDKTDLVARMRKALTKVKIRQTS
jgi:hypothetical protein